jgi:hypothetical protein
MHRAASLVLPDWQITILATCAICVAAVFGVLLRRARKAQACSVGRFVAWELESMADGAPHASQEIRHYVTTKSGLTEEQIKELLPKDVRADWTQAFLDGVNNIIQWGLADELEPGVYQLTDLGLLTTRHHPRTVSRYTPRLLHFYDGAVR